MNPARGVTVRVHVQSPLRVAEAFIDGVEVPGVGLRLLTGPHLLALTFEPAPRKSKTQVGLWALVFLEMRQPGVPTYPVQRVPRSESRADGSWRASAAAPSPDWASPAFDDSGWAPLQRSATAGQGLEQWQRRAFDDEVEMGTEPLALQAERVHVRKRFDFAGAAR